MQVDAWEAAQDAKEKAMKEAKAEAIEEGEAEAEPKIMEGKISEVKSYNVESSEEKKSEEKAPETEEPSEKQSSGHKKTPTVTDKGTDTVDFKGQTRRTSMTPMHPLLPFLLRH